MSDMPASAYGHAAAGVLLPPHFPDPNADPIAILQARIVELEEINAAQYAEMMAWRTQLEAALAKLAALENMDLPK